MTTHQPSTEEIRKVEVRQNYNSYAWKWMRYSGFLLIPLVWIHILLQDALVGAHKIDIGYVTARWATIGWRAYDAALLAFAFAHGVNGLHQVAFDHIHSERGRRILSILLFIGWLVIVGIGAYALVVGVKR